MRTKRQWRPSASQKREFAENMKNPEYATAYYARKEAREEKRRQTSKYDYNTAGGMYIATQRQYNVALDIQCDPDTTAEQRDAANMVIYSYTCRAKIHHDYIHVVNEIIRSNY